MHEQIESAILILCEFKAAGSRPGGVTPTIDRPQVVAHATLSAYGHHWPSRFNEQWRKLLVDTSDIKEAERTRWVIQRRIAIAKFCKELS